MRKAFARRTVVALALASAAAACSGDGDRAATVVLSSGVVSSGVVSTDVVSATTAANTDGAPIVMMLPDGWTALNDTDVDAGEWQVRVSWRDNDAVEAKIAAKHGLVDSLPLYDGKITMTEVRALGDPLARETGFLRVLVGAPPSQPIDGNFTNLEPAPWNNDDDVRAYLANVRRIGALSPVTINGMVGFSYAFDEILDERIYELVYEPGRRLFIVVYPADSTHAADIDAIITSIRRA